VAQLLVLVGLLGWLLGMVAERRLAWRCSALDWPLGLLIALVFVQLTLGNRPLAAWALASPGSPDAPPAFPSLVLTLGTLAPTHTISALRIFLTYAGAYVLVIHLIRTCSTISATRRGCCGGGTRPPRGGSPGPSRTRTTSAPG
jgi:hypothetical protein